MINARYVRDNIDAIRESLARRKMNYDLDRILELDAKWREIKTENQKLQEKRNRSSLEISAAKKERGLGREQEKIIADMAKIKADIDENEMKLAAYQTDLDKLILNIPNVLHPSVPYGDDAGGNTVIRTHMDASKRQKKGHEEIAEGLDQLEMARAARIAGARFYYLKNDLAMLDISLMRFALDTLIEKGFVPIEPPFMMKESYYGKVTSMDEFDKTLYKVSGGDDNDGLRMIATSEHPIAAMHSGEILETRSLPLKYAGFGPCFRMEAGTHGKDTKGIFRVHQFNKVEQFVFARHDDSWKIFDELIANSEEIFRKLEIPYRIVDICTGDIGTVAAKKYDLEAYMPSQGTYREMVSCSNCTDWQSSRLDIRYDEAGERNYVHTLNSTAIATSRTIVAIIENYANDDGTVNIPEALVPYMKKRIIG
jgi:seryl-tRNA synthetase